MPTMHEILTLQFGNRANYLATHFWNTQESYFTYPTTDDPTPAPSLVDHDVHFRPGIGVDGSDTYTPRTLVYDFQANFGGLRKENPLYEVRVRQGEVVKGLWDGNQQIIPTVYEPIQPIPYQVQLEAGLPPTSRLTSRDVRYWSDFNRIFYHPRSILPLSPQSSTSTLNAVENWSLGSDLFRDVDRQDGERGDILDRDVRAFVEECDSLSAFQVFTGSDDVWGGWASSYVEALREEYGKKCLWLWAVEGDSRTVEGGVRKRYQRLANSARSLRSLVQNASGYVRVANLPRQTTMPEYVHLETGSEWSTMGLLCAAMESVTLPTRLRSSGGDGSVGGVSVGAVEDMLNANGNQKVWNLRVQARQRTESAQNGGGSSSNSNSNSNANGTSSISDPRIRQPLTASTLDNTGSEPDPSSFDIDFTPSPPIPPTAFPSLHTTRPKHDSHVFTQLESYRFFPSHHHRGHRPPTNHDTSTLLYRLQSSLPILQTYHTPLPFPILDSYPSTLFSSSLLSLLPSSSSSSSTSFSSSITTTTTKHLQISASLSTVSSTKQDILSLRDVVAGNVGRSMRLLGGEGDDDDMDVDGMYDELTRVAEGYGFGWEEDDDFDEGMSEGEE